MIPIKLHLRNFLCYADAHEPLRFDGIHVACISGDNGHGKSALLDAITWALWGKCRADSADDLIHTGQTEMEVEFEFYLGEGRYRVLRKRSRGGRGQTTLDLHVVHEDGLRPLTGATVRETQERIVELVGMGYDTFINSSFLLQGRADEFTKKTPGERKQILAEILELGRYDELEARARDEAKARDGAVQQVERDIAAIDAELARRGEHEEALARLERERAALDLDLTRARTILQTLQDRQAASARARADLTVLEGAIADGRKQLAAVERQAAEHQERIAACERVVAQADEIDAGYARLVAVRAEVDALQDKADRANALEDERHRHQRAIEAARSALETTLRSLDKRLPNLQAAAARRPELKLQLAKAEGAAARYEGLQHQRAAQEQALATARGEQTALQQTTAVLRDQFKELQRNESVLAEAAQCPYCLTPLDATSRKHAVARCEEAKADLTARGKANKQRLAELETTIQEAEARLAQIMAEAAPLEKQSVLAGQLRQALQQAEEQAAEMAAAEAERNAVAAQLERGDYAPDDQAAVARLDAELATLGYDQKAHAARRAELRTLQAWEEQHRGLESAREALPRERELLSRATTAAEGWRTRLVADEARAAALRAEIGDAAALERELRAADAELRRLEGERRDRDQRIGSAKQILATLQFQEGERARLVEQRARLQEERGIYGELALAFGKKGLQAMLIESVIPELEQEANALLARMTDNRMHLKLETQRDTRQGNTIETLDIKLADELGTRNYELFSGGEAFRANFALRVGLSKLVARRAGAQVQLLVVDEGFGTQDAEGLERLVEAIKAIQDDFKKVLVITHVPEMKEVFPVRIDVRKTPRGSVFQIV
ncbi:MAG TPA: SMC family ATPase [Chloroflexota bacterium]|nr:SMC family ATPase [Chloroflexota bacterium]